MPVLPRLLALTAAAFVSIMPAAAGNVYFDWNKTPPRLPGCDAVSVRTAVLRTIARADVEYRGGITVKAMRRIGETGYQRGTPSPYARRYCTARADLSNGRTSRLYYMIEEYQGFAGLGWNVEACLSGYDRWHVYDAWCRVVRP